MHSALMTLTEKDFEDCTTAMIDLLEDPLFMCEIPEAKKHAAEIKEVSHFLYYMYTLTPRHSFKLLAHQIRITKFNLG